MMLLLAAPAAAQRGRIVGVFDQTSGDPIEGARVRDMLTGTSALTTKTGTVSLSFVDTAGTLLDGPPDTGGIPIATAPCATW